MEQQYKHQMLATPRSIRILQLEPATSKTDPLCCRLEDVSLNESPRYFALSYTWDAQVPTRPVDCGGKILSVTQNCATALNALRPESGEFPMWIDSICIDQTSTDERSHQVAMMSEIYQKAAVVIIWLGKVDESEREAMKRLKEAESRDLIMADSNAAADTIRDNVEQIEAGVRNYMDDPFALIFKKSWFQRMWTIQEAIFAKTAALCWGNETFEWRKFIFMVERLEISGHKWGHWRKVMQLQRHLAKLLVLNKAAVKKTDLHNFGLAPGENGDRPMLREILKLARPKTSSDPRDKIFALYGVLSELNISFPKPDYRKTAQEVFTEATLASFDHDKGLDILFQAPSASRTPDLPYWVPDWSVVEPTGSYDMVRITREWFLAGGRDFSPAKTNLESATWQLSPDSRILTLKGIIIDEVKENTEHVGDIDFEEWVYSGNPNAGDLEKYVLEKMKSFRKVFSEWLALTWSCHEHPTGETREALLERIVLSDLPISRKPFNIYNQGEFEMWHLQMLLWSHTIAKGSSEDMNFHELMDGELVEQVLFWSKPQDQLLAQQTYSKGPLPKIHHEIVKICSEKCLFSTAKGFLGTASGQIHPGDRIVITSGLSRPLVVRLCAGGFQLRSSAFIPGVMYGEAWPNNDDDLVDIPLI